MKNLNWQSLLKLDGAELEAHYIKLLSELGKQEGIIGPFAGSKPREILVDREAWLQGEKEQLQQQPEQEATESEQA